MGKKSRAKKERRERESTNFRDKTLIGSAKTRTLPVAIVPDETSKLRKVINGHVWFPDTQRCKCGERFWTKQAHKKHVDELALKALRS